MKENINKTSKNESAFVIISIFIIIIIFIYIAYLLFNSYNTLNSNVIENNMFEDINIESNVQEESATVQKQIIYQDVEIASYTSTLYDSSENRIYNISKACAILNDTTIEIGEEFSFNNTIGSMGTEDGYKLAKGFDSDGNVIEIAGGGMCQLSSTLYNVVLLANLEVTERHAHSKRVYYVPADKDATVYYPTLDFKFINNTENRLKITATCDNSNVTVKLYKIEQLN